MSLSRPVYTLSSDGKNRFRNGKFPGKCTLLKILFSLSSGSCVTQADTHAQYLSSLVDRNSTWGSILPHTQSSGCSGQIFPILGQLIASCSHSSGAGALPEAVLQARSLTRTQAGNSRPHTPSARCWSPSFPGNDPKTGEEGKERSSKFGHQQKKRQLSRFSRRRLYN